jgi:transcriptional regulator with XRE-family HTH domain
MAPFSGQELKQLRKDAGFTQQTLATRLKISRETISAIERDIPETINSLDIRIVQRWFKICQSSVSIDRKESFMHYVISYFRG